MKKRKNTVWIIGTILVFMFSLTYLSVPLYRLFCQKTGFGGTTQVATKAPESIIDKPPIRVSFQSDVNLSMPWSFKPAQNYVNVHIGESALAFFTAKNKANTDITGVATYNITPMKAARYFHKIQCFCFDQQRLGAHESVDMPVLFYIDPEFSKDPYMGDVNHITLSYTFFKVDDDE